jgi:hypothetical protein
VAPGQSLQARIHLSGLPDGQKAAEEKLVCAEREDDRCDRFCKQMVEVFVF